MLPGLRCLKRDLDLLSPEHAVSLTNLLIDWLKYSFFNSFSNESNYFVISDIARGEGLWHNFFSKLEDPIVGLDPTS